MRYKEITEAPIGNLEVHGMDQPGSFPDLDRKMLSNPKHIENIRKRFENVPFDFHLYFINRNVEYTKDYQWHESDPNDPDKDVLVKHTSFSPEWNTDYDKYNGISNEETVKEWLGMTIPADPDAITVIFTSNANADNRVSMTPWMVGHRFGHALMDNVRKLPAKLQWNVRQLEDFLSGKPKDIFNFRSARTGKLIGGEEFPELIAQYCNGGIKMDIKTRPELIHTQRRIGVLIDRIMEECVGHIFIAL